jgi:hypothetical protein
VKVLSATTDPSCVTREVSKITGRLGAGTDDRSVLFGSRGTGGHLGSVPVDSEREVSRVRAKVALHPTGTSTGRPSNGATVDDGTIQHEVFASFAQHLVPEAFATPTRADRVSLETSGPAPVDRAYARARFDRWIDDRIEDALAASWPHDRPLVVAFTSDGYLLRRYDENGCGHLDCVVGLVQTEVAAIDTPWVFGAALPRPQPFLETLYDEDDNEVAEVLRPPSISFWTATWYAEARGGGVAESFAGELHLDAEVVVAAGPLHVRATAVTREFHRMLYRHPARRLHPLRRR